MPIIERVAVETARWSGMEPDDIAGALGAVVARRITDYLVVLSERGAAGVEMRLRAEAGRLAARERVRRQRESGQYFYDPEYVRLFLPHWFARQDWASGPTPDDVTRGDGWATGEAIDTAIDITLAFPRLRDWQKRVIWARHVYARPLMGGAPDWQAVADMLGYASAKSAEQSYRNATASLAVEMNTCRADRIADHDGPGSRKAISNATARAAINNNDMDSEGGSL